MERYSAYKKVSGQIEISLNLEIITIRYAMSTTLNLMNATQILVQMLPRDILLNT